MPFWTNRICPAEVNTAAPVKVKDWLPEAAASASIPDILTAHEAR
ncbi:hypothetical protein [Primorskyibacter sedentarius]